MNYQNTLAYSQEQDAKDPLALFREKFHHPIIDGKQVLYFTGNSLGLAPKSARDYINKELDEWECWGVEGHFEAEKPWVSYHEILTPATARLVGAKESEVVCMGTLTNNLHLLFVSFYKPTAKRYKIISEAKMFPSDRYLLETQVRHHGLEPDDAIIEISPREGEHLIREGDIIAAIEEHSDELAMLFIGGMNYFTGQLFNIQKLTDVAHKYGAIIGVDLAHAAGNVPLELHDWDVDFAAWCTYKYINSSAGNVAGLFVHERHGNNTSINRFGGWWGHNKERRFLMENSFDPMKGAEGWQISNAPVMGMSLLKASLDIFDEAGIHNLREKSIKLTGYLEFTFNQVLKQFPNVKLEIITPTEPQNRGAQLSIKLIGTDMSFFNQLTAAGVISDFRAPDVIRLAPAPLYNSFEDVYQFGRILNRLLAQWN